MCNSNIMSIGWYRCACAIFFILPLNGYIWKLHVENVCEKLLENWIHAWRLMILERLSIWFRNENNKSFGFNFENVKKNFVLLLILKSLFKINKLFSYNQNVCLQCKSIKKEYPISFYRVFLVITFERQMEPQLL